MGIEVTVCQLAKHAVAHLSKHFRSLPTMFSRYPPFRSCLPQLRASLPFVRLTLAVIFRSCLPGLVQNLVGASSMFDFCTSPVIFLVALVGSHNLQPGVREICMQRNDLPHGKCTRRLATSTKPSIDAKFHKYVSQPERLVVTTTGV